MDIYEIHAAALASVQVEMGTDCPQFVWSGAPWLALPSSRAGGKPLGWGGFVPDAGLQLMVVAAQFGNGPLPQLKQKLSFQGFTFRINEINGFPNGHQFELVCSLETAGS